MGYSTTAKAACSTAIGDAASANGHNGSLVFGDSSTTTEVVATASYQFVVRAAGETTFCSNSAMSAGVSLAAGSGAWASPSDAHMKTNFRDLDGEMVLAKLAEIRSASGTTSRRTPRSATWGRRRRTSDAAFGLGDNDRTFSTLDPDGTSLKAIQALRARSGRLQEQSTRNPRQHRPCPAQTDRHRGLRSG